jgi:hypothetical protein
MSATAYGRRLALAADGLQPTSSLQPMPRLLEAVGGVLTFRRTTGSSQIPG